MTPEQLAAAKTGDEVTLQGRSRNGERLSRGRITQTTPRWFMVVWYDGTPEIVRRTPSVLADRLHLLTPKKDA